MFRMGRAADRRKTIQAERFPLSLDGMASRQAQKQPMPVRINPLISVRRFNQVGAAAAAADVAAVVRELLMA